MHSIKLHYITLHYITIQYIKSYNVTATVTNLHVVLRVINDDAFTHEPTCHHMAVTNLYVELLGARRGERVADRAGRLVGLDTRQAEQLGGFGWLQSNSGKRQLHEL